MKQPIHLLFLEISLVLISTYPIVAVGVQSPKKDELRQGSDLRREERSMQISRSIVEEDKTIYPFVPPENITVPPLFPYIPPEKITISPSINPTEPTEKKGGTPGAQEESGVCRNNTFIMILVISCMSCIMTLI